MAWLISLALSAGVPQRFAKAAGIAALVALVLTLLSIGKCTYDRNLIGKHDAAINLDAATAGRAADGNAAIQRQADTTRAAMEADQLEKVTENASSPDDARRAYYRCVRLQQSARTNGERPPACQ